jgi:phosphohistidine swiveling domain-containing protein
MNFKDIITITKKRTLDSPVIERCPGVLHGIWPPGYALVEGLEKLGLGWKWIYFVIKDKNLVDMFSEKIMIQHAATLLAKELENPGNYAALIKEWKKLNRAFHKVVHELETSDLAALQDKELTDLYIRFMEAQIKIWAIPLTSNNISTCADKVWVPAILKKYGQKGIEEFTTLSTPTEDSFIKTEEKELLRIAAEYHNSSETANKSAIIKIKSHAEKFHWITNNYKDVKKLDEGYFLEKIKHIKNPTQSQHDLGEEERKFMSKHASLLKKNMFTKEECTKALLVAEAAILQDRRKRNNLISLYYIFEFLKEFSKRTSYSFEELCTTSYFEMKQIALSLDSVKRDEIKDKAYVVPKSELASRVRCCAVLIEIGSGELGLGKVYGGKEAEELFRIIDTADDVKKGVEELRGVSASLGKAKGRARIVLDVSNVKQFNEGDILIASMTRPEYMPLMKKAAAIVTNEGGISSHAAILSRELRKPCIIGTKFATKVFKDGDIVEVDADKGIVRKIDKK